MIVKDELPRIFMNSQRSKDLCPDLQPGEAAAVCLARYCQEPLGEYCGAWKSANAQEIFGHELLFLKTHPQQDLLKGAKQALLNALEQRLVDAVCDVGVDVNKACAYDHLAPMLAFVGGLGLRKADALRQNIRKGAKTITMRNDLLVRKLLGTNVWTNAAGFLRICGDATQDPLDNTRIHPECYATYDFATKICADALEVAHSHSDYYGIVEKLMASSRKVLEKRMERHRRWLDLWEGGQRPIPGVTPYDETARTVDGREVPLDIELNDMLAQLELDDYATELEASGQGKRRLLLDQIKDELRFPYLDLRLPVATWTPQEMFFLLTNQTDRSVYVGMKVGGTVVEVSDDTMLDERTGDYRRRQRAVVQTEAGLRGFVSMFDAVDRPSDRPFSWETFNLTELLFVGKHIEAVVVGVKKDKLSLDLSIKPSQLDKTESWWMAQRFEEKQARDWWESLGKDPSRLFDRYFRESEALRVCREEEDAQQLSAAAVNQQLSTTTIGGMGRDGGKGAGGARSLMRVVHHPLFANLDFKAAEERMRLEGKGAGEILIRPSSKGPNYLTITWAFQDNWFKHISVEERGKRAGDLGVGPQLYVQEDDLREPYHDLDELFSRYIEPMNDLVSVVLKHRSFRRGTPAEVEALMYAERAENPTRIPYFFRFEPNKPGIFVLTWLSLNIKSEAPVRTLRIEVRPYVRVQKCLCLCCL
jgi:transcription elongation factor SPT6